MQDPGESWSPAAQSVLLLSEQNARHVCGVLRYLRRAGALLPPELLQFALGVQQAKEEQKTDRPLCCSLKSFGFCRSLHQTPCLHQCERLLLIYKCILPLCRDSTVCPDRHMINKSLDHPKHPDTGTVMVSSKQKITNKSGFGPYGLKQSCNFEFFVECEMSWNLANFGLGPIYTTVFILKSILFAMVTLVVYIMPVFLNLKDGDTAEPVLV